MPEVTLTGANTAGCVVDGLPWVVSSNIPKIGPGTFPAVTASWNNFSAGQPNYLSLSFDKYIADEAQVHNQTTIVLELPGITRPGTFVLDQPAIPRSTSPAYASFTFAKPNPDQELLTGSGSPGRVVVTRFDTLSRVVPGTFEFTARQAAAGTTVRVTEGRFDCTS